MEIKMDDVNFKEAFVAAILQSFDENKKAELIKGAVAHLLSPSDKSSWNNKNKLQEAFETALRAETVEFIRKFIAENEEIKGHIEGLIKDAVTRITTTNRETTVNKIAEKIIEGLTPERY